MRLWRPQPGPQVAFVESPYFEVIFGGARGGGKTDAALGDFARHERLHGEGARGLMVRRARVALGPTIERARQIFGPEGATWNGSRSCFHWPSGAILYFRYLANDADADLYQGHAYTRVYIEELTQFPSPGPVDKLKATLRSAAGVPCGLRATCNPGGAGHVWVKERYIDAGPNEVVEETFVSPFDGSQLTLTRLFIPARLADNPALMANDPGYVARLQMCGSDTLVKAWLEGDWSATHGAFFDKWSLANIVEPFGIPEDWFRFRALDWGGATPFSVGWWAVAGDDHWVGERRMIPRGALVRYREWYGRDPRTRKGLKLNAEQLAAGIHERERGDHVEIGVADPSIGQDHGFGESILDVLGRNGLYMEPGENRRVGRMGDISGWDRVRVRIEGQNGCPMLYVFSDCRDFIRTVPVLGHDPDRPEDLDTGAEDHIADETRYACAFRPWGPIVDPRQLEAERTARWREEWPDDGSLPDAPVDRRVGYQPGRMHLWL